MRSNEETQIILESELKNNGLILEPSPQKKQSLLQCLGSSLGMDSEQLHEKICSGLLTAYEQNTLPRRLAFVRKDKTMIEDYKKYPYLVNFINITLEMVSHIKEIKITSYSLNKNDFVVGQIVNEKNYQHQVKVARIQNNFYKVKDNQQSSCSQVMSNNSIKLFQAFQEKPLKNAIQSPILTKSVSVLQEPKKIIEPVQKSYDELSIENKPNVIEQNQPYVNDSFSQSIQQDTYSNNLPQYNPMYPYNQYQQMYYQTPYLYRTSSNKSQGYINSYTNIPPQQNQLNTMSPGKLSSSRRQNSTMEFNENQRYTGRLKFFDEAKNYGFIIMDADESDIFVHCDDLQKAGINKEKVKSYKQSQGLIRFSFKVMSYFGKYKDSRKAVDLVIIDDGFPNISYQ